MATIVEHVAGLSIGWTEMVTAAELRIRLFAETPQATVLNTGTPTGFPRINAYILVPNEGGAVVAVVKEIAIVRQATPPGYRDDNLVDLPFPARTVIAIPFGTLLAEERHKARQRSYRLERGVPVLPSVGDTVLSPTREQLKSIVECAAADRLVRIGTAPFAGNTPVWVHPDRMFGRHLAILGNTGSGKSCSVAGLIRWSIEAAASAQGGSGTSEPNARFIILDPNGEYANAFRDGAVRVRRFAVGGTGDIAPLAVPGWIWNGQEWSAFTAAQGGVQRPILLRALRLLRNAGSAHETTRARVLHRYRGYLHQFEQHEAEVPRSIQGFPANKNFGDKLEGLRDLLDDDQRSLGDVGGRESELVTAVGMLASQIEGIRASRLWSSGGAPDITISNPWTYEPSWLASAPFSIVSLTTHRMER